MRAKTFRLSTIIDIFEEKKYKRGQKIIFFIFNNVKFPENFINEIEMAYRKFIDDILTIFFTK